MFNKQRGVWFNQDDGGGGSSSDDSDDNNQQEADDPESEFSAWLETQPDDVKTALNKHTKNLLSALQKERKNASKVKPLEKSLKDLQDADDTRKKQALTKEEQLESRAVTAEGRASTSESELRKLRLQTAVEREAVKLKFADPQDAYRLIDLTDLTIEDDGKVTGAAEALKVLVETKPYLVTAKKVGDGVGSITEGRSKRNQKGDEKTPLPKPRVSI